MKKKILAIAKVSKFWIILGVILLGLLLMYVLRLKISGILKVARKSLKNARADLAKEKRTATELSKTTNSTITATDLSTGKKTISILGSTIYFNKNSKKLTEKAIANSEKLLEMLDKL